MRCAGRTPSTVLVVLVVLARAALASAADEPPPVVFRGQVDVDVATLYVTVLDRDEQPIPDLTATDFTVIEGGEERPITYFEAVGTGAAQPDGIPDEDFAAPPGTARDTVVLAFDNARLERRNRKRVLASLRELVPALTGDGLRLMVTADDRTLRPPTLEPEAVLEALDEVADTPVEGDSRKAERRFLLRDVSAAGLRPSTVRALAPQLELQIDLYRDRERQATLHSLARLEQLIRAVAGVSGRTTVVWVTQDLSLRPANDVYRRFYNRFGSLLGDLTPPELWGTENELLRIYAELVGLAQGAGVTLQTVDASDRDRDLADTDVRGPDPATATDGRVSSFGYDFSETHDSIDGAQYLGYGSGGDFYGNTRNFAPFTERLAATVGTYYVLGYQPDPDRDGLRSVKVEVGRAGARVRHPEKVRTRPPEQELVDATVSALLFGEPFNPLGITLSFGEADTSRPDVVTWPIDLLVPVAGLLPDTDGRAQVTVALSVVEADGSRTAPFVTRLRLAVPDDADAIGTAALDVATRPEAARLALSLRDEAAGTVSTVVVAVPSFE